MNRPALVYRPLMPTVYRWMLTVSGGAFLWVSMWDQLWLRPISIATGLALILVGWFPAARRARRLAAYLAAFAGIGQVVELVLWNPPPGVSGLTTMPGVVPWLALVVYTVLLTAFGWVPAREGQ